MRLLALALVLAACSKPQPKYTDEIAARIKTLAPDCTSEKYVPGGYDEVISCQPADHTGYVTVMLVDQRIYQLNFDLATPTVDAAIAMISPAIDKLVAKSDLDAIAAAMRDFKPPVPPAVLMKVGRWAQVGVEREAGKTKVVLLLDWRTE